jgi:hypothetical protein
VKAPDTKASRRVTALRYLHAMLRHVRSNVVAYIALAVAVGSGGGYALAAVSASNGTIAVCVDKGSGVMHLAEHPRCGRGQRRIGLEPSLDAWAAVSPNGDINVGAGLSITHGGVGTYDVTVTAASCRHAQQNAPVVSVDDAQPPAGLASQQGAFPVAWTQGIGFTGKNLIIHTGVVVNGEFQPRDETFNITDSCGFPPGT